MPAFLSEIVGCLRRAPEAALDTGCEVVYTGLHTSSSSNIASITQSLVRARIAGPATLRSAVHTKLLSRHKISLLFYQLVGCGRKGESANIAFMCVLRE